MKKIFIAFVVAVLFLAFVYQGAAYMPTAEQVLERTAKLNRHLTSLKAEAKTTLFSEDFDEEALEVPEVLYVTAGGSFRSERYLPYGSVVIIHDGRKTMAAERDHRQSNHRIIETVFPTVFFPKSLHTLLDDLSFLGVETHIVTFDRTEQGAAYVIGRRIESVPGSQLWIDKKRGFPLRFVGVSTSDDGLITLRVEYKDYRRVKKRFWLPEKIEYYKNEVLYATCSIDNFAPNTTVSQSLFTSWTRQDGYLPLVTFLNLKE